MGHRDDVLMDRMECGRKEVSAIDLLLERFANRKECRGIESTLLIEQKRRIKVYENNSRYYK